MKLSSTSFGNGEAIAANFALGAPDAEAHVTLAANINPQLSWRDVPEGTRSLVLICCDPDVPSRPDDVNQEGRTVPADLPRVDFYHWTLVDISPDTTGIAEGEYSTAVTARGKAGPDGPNGTRQGLNDYTSWFAGDADMGGDYYGYDGPCPPWNDSIVHHYQFTLYALDVERCPVDGTFTGPEVLKAIDRHVLGEARITGTYSLNPKVPA